MGNSVLIKFMSQIEVNISTYTVLAKSDDPCKDQYIGEIAKYTVLKDGIIDAKIYNDVGLLEYFTTLSNTLSMLLTGYNPDGSIEPDKLMAYAEFIQECNDYVLNELTEIEGW